MLIFIIMTIMITIVSKFPINHLHLQPQSVAMRPPPCLASHLGGATVSSDQVTFILVNIINLTFLILVVIKMLNDGISTLVQVSACRA